LVLQTKVKTARLLRSEVRVWNDDSRNLVAKRVAFHDFAGKWVAVCGSLDHLVGRGSGHHTRALDVPEVN